MADRIWRRTLLGWAMLALTAGVAACDSPTLDSRAADGGAARVIVPSHVADTARVAVADSQRTDLYDPNCWISTGCPTTGTVTVAEPGGNVTIGTYGSTWNSTVAVGGSSYGFQLGVTNGSFIGIIWSNGTFQGYWGYCLFPGGINDWYKTTDPATGKTYVHWENQEPGTQQMYHYIYDPSTNTLKVYHKQRNGTTSLIYQGAPIKDKTKLPPPDPAAGAGPYTNENQYATGAPIPPAPTGTTTPTSGTPTGTTTGSGLTGSTPNSTSSNTPAGMSSTGSFDRHWSTGGAPLN